MCFTLKSALRASISPKIVCIAVSLVQGPRRTPGPSVYLYCKNIAAAGYSSRVCEAYSPSVHLEVPPYWQPDQYSVTYLKGRLLYSTYKTPSIPLSV